MMQPTRRFPPRWSVKKLTPERKTMAACWLCLIQLRGSHFTTADLDDAVRLALKGLTQKSAA